MNVQCIQDISTVHRADFSNDCTTKKLIICGMWFVDPQVCNRILLFTVDI